MFYQEMQKIANSVLKQFRQGDIKLYHYTESSGGTLDEPAELKEDIYDLDATISGVSYEYLITNNYVAASDITITAAVIPDIYITINDFIKIKGEKYKLIKDISVAPTAVEGTGQPVVWRFICRKG